VRVAFAGTPDFAVPALEALHRSGRPLVAVLTQPDRPAGRGQRLQQSAVKIAALRLGIPVAQPATLKTPEGLQPLIDAAPDVLVVAAYGLILPRAALAVPRLGCINIHASLLPRWRGAAPIQRAILAGDTQSGVSIMVMEPGLDTGPVLRTRSVPIDDSTTGGSLHDALAALGAVEIVAALADLEAGQARAMPQSAAGVTYAPKIDKAEARIDWRESALAIARRVRAFDPWPICDARAGDEILRIHAARVHAGARPANADVGCVLGLEGDALLVACGTGVLAVLRVQRPGRKPVSAREFANATSLDALRFA
jgi:methionyl-tRNA formyltransferase